MTDEERVSERVADRRRDWTTFIGGTMVLVGLAFFVVVFAALFPVLTDPAGAYDRWFPREERIAEESETDRTANPYLGPSARFAWETLTVEDGDPPLYRVRLESQARSGSTAVVEWKWDFGDGTTGTGESIIHDYDAAASYTVTLAIEDASGRGDSVRGSVPVGSSESILGSAGNIDGLVGFDDELDAFTDDISASLEDAVGSVGDDITDTLDTALGSIGATVRGAVVAVLFALAALAATLVAWRTARIGVMLLTGDSDARSVRSLADPIRDEPGPRRQELEAVS